MVIANEAHSAELAIYQRACGINIFVPQFRGTLGIKNSDFPITLAYSLPLQEHTLSEKELKGKKKPQRRLCLKCLNTLVQAIWIVFRALQANLGRASKLLSVQQFSHSRET